MMFLSVIIPTRNRAKYLSGALESLTRQTYPLDMFEVLVIDNGSTDNTREVCASFKNRVPQLRYFYEETPGLHVGRHLGMKMAKSEILVYADDDIEAFPTWLEGIADSFQNEQVVLVGGKILPKWEKQPPDWILDMWEKKRPEGKTLGYLSILDLGDITKMISANIVFGCNFSIRKYVLLNAGGFHPDSMPQNLIRYRGDGESHVSNYIEKNILKSVYNPNASVFHYVTAERMSKEYFFKRSYMEGISRSYTDIRSYYMNTNEKLPAVNLMPCFRLIREYAGFLICWFMKRLNIATKSKSHFDIFQIQLKIAFWKGWLFHNQNTKSDLSLYEWVIKHDYYSSYMKPS